MKHGTSCCEGFYANVSLTHSLSRSLTLQIGILLRANHNTVCFNGQWFVDLF